MLPNTKLLNIISEKFHKNERLDKSIIDFIREINSKLIKTLKLYIKNRVRENNDIVNSLRKFPVFDEFMIFV